MAKKYALNCSLFKKEEKKIFPSLICYEPFNMFGIVMRLTLLLNFFENLSVFYSFTKNWTQNIR